MLLILNISVPLDLLILTRPRVLRVAPVRSLVGVQWEGIRRRTSRRAVLILCVICRLKLLLLRLRL